MTNPASSLTPPTQLEIDTARRLGVSVELYRQFKCNAGDAARQLEEGAEPADVRAEQTQYERMRRESGLFKRRNQAPNIFVAAAKTPGEVARMLLTVFCYLALMFGILFVYGLEQVSRIPGIFQTIGLGLLVIPAMILSSIIWRTIGETARDVLRLLVRFWPVTVMVLIFLLGSIKLLLG